MIGSAISRLISIHAFYITWVFGKLVNVSFFICFFFSVIDI
jgi:hypothetical protein